MKAIVSLLLLSCIILTEGCGQTGPLYLPAAKPATPLLTSTAQS